MSEEGVRRFLEEECYTTKEERDPNKPLILDGDWVLPNPSFDPGLAEKGAAGQEVERRKPTGTSFVLNFDNQCSTHQIRGALGDKVRGQIVRMLCDRFIEVFRAQFPDNPPPEDVFDDAIKVGLDEEKHPGFNNGEIFIWLPRILLKEDFVLKVLIGLKSLLEENPIIVHVETDREEFYEVKNGDYAVWFYGWGFRYY